MQQTIGFLGGGHMSNAIISGLVSSNATRPQIMVSNRGKAKLDALCKRFKVQPASNNAALISHCDVVILSVKPQQIQTVIEPLKPLFQTHKPLVISVAAGIQCQSLQHWLGEGIALIRAMPNVPSVIREGATGLYADKNASHEQKTIAAAIFNTIGITTWHTQEEDIDRVTAVSGSGPAYFMLMIKSLADAATQAGMDYNNALQLAIQTARGTAGMLANSEKTIDQMIAEMLLPGGTTEQAVASLQKAEFSATIKRAFNAANNRAAELAKELKP